MPPMNAEQLFSAGVLGLAGIFFAQAAWLTLFSSTSTSTSPSPSSPSSQQEAAATSTPSPPPKPPSASAVRVTYSTHRPEMTQHYRSSRGERPTIRAGALLRLIDVVAGVCARRHAGNSCVTVSIDAVVFLSSVFVGELLHLDASVNRAFGSSMEIGVRIQKEVVATGHRSYVAHSYLTFVGLPRPGPGLSTTATADEDPPSSGFSLRPALGVRVRSQTTGESTAPRPPRVKLAPVAPSNMLEARRHLLAGRRRETRMRAAKAAASGDVSPSGVSSALRDEVRYMQPLSSEDGSTSSSSSSAAAAAAAASQQRNAEKNQAQRVEMLELELVTRAVAVSDPTVRIVTPAPSSSEPAQVIVSLPGDEPIIHTLDEVRDCALRLGLVLPPSAGSTSKERLLDDGAALTLSPPISAKELESQDAPLWTDWQRRMSVVHADVDGLPHGTAAMAAADVPEEIRVESTLVQSLNLVFPQHANSVSVLFGGQLAEWLEETALLSVRHLRGSWHTVAMDGLPFKEGVAIGEVMICHAVVTDLWLPPVSASQSSALAEVLVVAEAEARDGSRRVTNEALFTLRSELGGRGRHGGGGARRVLMPPGSELERFAAGAQKRRLQRLELGDLLVRLYSK